MMQVLHYATFASVAASERPNLAVSTPSNSSRSSDVSTGRPFPKNIEMKICVLGAGVIGLTTAWRLAEAGHDVIVVDRNVSTWGRRQRCEWRPAQLRLRGAAGLAGAAAEASIAIDVEGVADPYSARLRPRFGGVGRAFPARLPLERRARDHWRPTCARRLEPERIGAAVRGPWARVRIEDRGQARRIPDRQGIRHGARRNCPDGRR